MTSFIQQAKKHYEGNRDFVEGFEAIASSNAQLGILAALIAIHDKFDEFELAFQRVQLARKLSISKDGKYVYIDISSGLVQIKLDDEGVIVDFFDTDGKCFNSMGSLYTDFEVVDDDE